MSRLIIALSIAAGLGVAGPCAAQVNSPVSPAPPMSREAYGAAKESAEAQYELDRDACKTLSDNAREICTVEAKGKERIARAQAEAAYENTPKAREHARLAQVRADYQVSKEKCGDFAGHRKDVCQADAEAALVKGKEGASSQ